VTASGGASAAPSIGLFAVNQHADGEAARRIATLAEQLGYDSLWVGEHVVVPDPRRPPSPMGPLDPILDPLVALAFLAAHTERVRLATGIVILPQRNPVVLAKQLASLDVVSGGRLTFGMGVGYLESEMTAIGVPMKGRGARAIEYLEAMRALWEQELPSFEGEFVDFDGINAYPRPVQRPLPVVMGGHSPAAHERAVRHANGWYGFMLDLEQTADQLADLSRRLEGAGRVPSEFEISVTPRGHLDAEEVAAYGRLGVNRLVLVPRGSALAEVETFVQEHSPERIGGAGLESVV
jgi:probable F420-dependent oxidoreductase